MKKTYSKPMAELIDFSLSSSVANTCGEETPPPEGLFNALGVCLIIDGVDLCYHNPSEDSSTFTS